MRLDEIADIGLPSQQEIPAENWGPLTVKIAELNRKAAKIGVPPITVTKHAEVYKTLRDSNDKPYKHLYYVVSVTGDTPKIAGWNLVAALDHEAGGNVIRALPGQEVPSKYRNVEPHCEHCGHNRRRRNTFILVNDQGEYAQVGRSCIADFLGHQDPKKILMAASWLKSVDSALADASDYSGYEDLTELKLFLGHVATMVRTYGWLSKGQASANALANAVMSQNGSYGGKPTDSTAGRAWQNMYPTPLEKKNCLPVTQEDHQQAADALNYVLTDVAAKPNRTDFEHNLLVVAGSEFIKYRHAGIAAAIIPAYLRHLEWYREQQEKKRQAALQHEQQKQAAQWIGDVGAKLKWTTKTDGLILKLVDVKPYNGNYGTTYLHRFVDRNNNIATWWASVDSGMEKGHWYKINATVKANDIYRDVKQTVLTRVSWDEDLGQGDME